VLGRGFAQLRLENEAAGTGDLHARFQPLGDFHVAGGAAAQFHRLCLEAVVGTHEHRGFVLDGLDRGFRHGHFRFAAVSGDPRADEQPRSPRALRVFQGHAHGRGASLFAEQTADVSHAASHFSFQFRRTDGDRFAHLHLGQVLGRNAEGHPHAGQVRQGERGGGFIDHLARRQVFFHHHAVEWRAQFVAIAAGSDHAAAEHADFLSGVVHGDFRFFQPLPGLEEILLGGDLVLPQLLFAFVGGARQRQATLRGSLFTALIGYLLTGDHRQQLALLHRLPEIDRHRLDHPRHARHDVCRAVLVEAHFAGKRQAETDALRPRLGQLNACGGDLLGAQFDVAFFGMFAFGGSALLGVIGVFGGLIGMRVDI